LMTVSPVQPEQSACSKLTCLPRHRPQLPAEDQRFPQSQPQSRNFRQHPRPSHPHP